MIIIGVLIIAIAASLGAYLLIFLQSVKEYKLEAREFGFNGFSGGPTLTVKVGETVRINLVNRGGIKHEFMVVKDKDAFLSEAHKVIGGLMTQGMKDAEEIEESHEYHAVMEKWGLKILKVDKEFEEDVEVEPAKTVVFEIKFTTPGTYWYLCGALVGTLPQTHADRGMFGQIVVQS